MMTDKTILLIEDNAGDEELTLRALRKSGVLNRVVVVRDGVEALDYLFLRRAYVDRTPATPPQLILLDLKLPKIDGIGVLKAIRAHESTRLLPVVVLTSSVEEQDLVRSYGHGANSYVRKPVDFVEFVEAVRQLGVYWLLLNQSAPQARANEGEE